MQSTESIRRVANLRGPLELVRSERGSLHCYQASMIMAVRALTGSEISMPEAERLTGYVPGRDTWPYAMFLGLADFGLQVTAIEVIDPHRMAAGASAEIRRIYGDTEVGNAILKTTDVEAETERAARCVAHRNIAFEVRTPTFTDVMNGVGEERLTLAGIDYGVLHETDEFEGHMVLVSGVSAEQVELFDPGPPGDAGRIVSRALFDEALHQPAPESGMLIILDAHNGEAR